MLFHSSTYVRNSIPVASDMPLDAKTLFKQVAFLNDFETAINYIYILEEDVHAEKRNLNC